MPATKLAAEIGRANQFAIIAIEAHPIVKNAAELLHANIVRKVEEANLKYWSGKGTGWQIRAHIELSIVTVPHNQLDAAWSAGGGAMMIAITFMGEFGAQYVLPNIETPDSGTFPASLEIVEWRMQSERRMYFCDGSGFPLDDTQPGIHAPGFNFTAYLKSDYFARLLAENRLEIANLDAPTSRVLGAAKDTMRDHFRRRASEKAAGLVFARWQTFSIAQP